MKDYTWRTSFNDPESTAKFAARLGNILQPGDVILLSGDIGAGKTHFARHLIQSLLEVPEDVPSPTFTLIQVYETRIGVVQHADLYRLSGPDEISELGLNDACGTDICLVEWPDRLGDDTPENALSITFTNGETLDERNAVFYFTDQNFANRFKDLIDE